MSYAGAMEFEWDAAKSERNLHDRGFGFDYAALIFLGDTIEQPDLRRGYGEVRIRAVGMVDGFCLAVTYTMRGEVRRILSAHLASRRDRDVYRSTFPE
ncbi:MAG TPA: BrnT family toxin [Azospirillaceae bacterium]|nr:BrnT family toxin [Azospirillaceae bacterium]